MITDNPVLLRNHKIMPVLMCGQKKGQKVVPTEDDLINGNIASFGCEVGQITNRCTAMYEVRSVFEPDSAEYRELEYRICCSQQAQQDSMNKSCRYAAMYR